MKKILVSGLAAIMAATAFVGAAEAGSWGGYYGNDPYYHHNHHHYYRHYDPGPAIVAGTIFGMIGSALANGPHYNSYAGPSSHTDWCEWRYKTYNPATDQFYAKPGVLQYCHSPYDR